MFCSITKEGIIVLRKYLTHVLFVLRMAMAALAAAAFTPEIIHDYGPNLTLKFCYKMPHFYHSCITLRYRRSLETNGIILFIALLGFKANLYRNAKPV